MAKLTSLMRDLSSDATASPLSHPRVVSNTTSEDSPDTEDDVSVSTDQVNVAGTLLSPESSPAVSPRSKKRAIPEPSQEDEPNRKRSKDSPPASPVKSSGVSSPQSSLQSETLNVKIDKGTWQGFCEIESEPAYFSVILREMGVEAVTVGEVFAMEPTIIETLPQPIYGLILLFRFREFGNEDQAAECPADVWFANQLPAQNSCATLAMINILMNTTEVKVGEHLTQFKDFTRDLTPFQRGEALASFDFVKRIHNSFAKKMDILESDKFLSHKVRKAERLKKETISKKKEEQSEKLPKKGTTTSSTRRTSADSTATDSSADSYQDNGHHFIAFVPVGTQVWKLDGFDAQPTSIGTFDPSAGETWLSGASDTIATLMAAGDDEYGVIALAQSPLVPLRKKACLAINTARYIETRLTSLSAEWTSFVAGDEQLPSPRMLGIEDQMVLHPMPAGVKAQIDAQQMSELLARRIALGEELVQLASEVLAEVEQEGDEERKAMQRRYDCGPVIQRWLEMLAGNGYLEENLAEFMPAGRGGT